MKVLVISGFLGAGKTTFIKELAERTHKDFAVMENEYGEAAIDGAVLSQSSEKLNIWELTEGCICCSMKSDFANSVLTIANTVDPEYLIVEPTGVGMLSKVLENLSQIQYDKIRLLSPVTILDGNSFDRYLKEYPEIFEDQLKSTGTVLISKMESASPEELTVLSQKVRQLAPAAELILSHYTKQEEDWYADLLCRDLSGRISKGSDWDTDLENLGLTDVSLQSPDQLVLFLNGIVSGLFGNICRSKGYLKAGDSWLHFDTADRTYSLTGCGPMKDSRAVFIGKDLKRSWLREVLQQEITVTAYKAPSRRLCR